MHIEKTHNVLSRDMPEIPRLLEERIDHMNRFIITPISAIPRIGEDITLIPCERERPICTIIKELIPLKD